MNDQTEVTDVLAEVVRTSREGALQSREIAKLTRECGVEGMSASEAEAVAADIEKDAVTAELTAREAEDLLAELKALA